MSKLTHDVSVSELQQMRESGMTNREIADSLGVSYTYILKLIGKQPKSLTAKTYAERGQRGIRLESRRAARNTTFANAPNAAKSAEDVAPAALMVQNSIMELVSIDTSRTYLVDKQARTVELVGGFKLSADTLAPIIAELSAIQRNLAQHPGMALEAW